MGNSVDEFVGAMARLVESEALPALSPPGGMVALDHVAHGGFSVPLDVMASG